MHTDHPSSSLPGGSLRAESARARAAEDELELQALEAQLRELEALAESMAQALQQLDCPAQCGTVHAFIETGAALHMEELEWACVWHVARHRCSRGS